MSVNRIRCGVPPGPNASLTELMPSPCRPRGSRDGSVESSSNTHATPPYSTLPCSTEPKPAAELGLEPGQTAILFLGSARRHKGLHSVVEALDLLGRKDITFLTVGGMTGLPHRAYVQSLGTQPMASLPRFLSAADIVVVAQRPGPATKGQMPAKTYDALSMGRAIIATDVSDLRATVTDCGLVVPPDDVPALAAAIGRLADDPQQRRELGDAGRHRAIERFSETAIRPRLLGLVESTVASYSYAHSDATPNGPERPAAADHR